ncbi:alpha/beta-hydrolase [Heliocybe sulcata]|uniref:triacylglycerol lipase n=1 Tax=Heliocybe sulcata TaxID=5364 RepID=A0A5C3MNM1_9AGAM|nr:alpha/beta-hydrolase [Heliocybe sulcata]
MLQLLPGALRFLWTTLLWSSDTRYEQPSLTFELRHAHGVANGTRNVFTDLGQSLVAESFSVKTRRSKLHRPSSQNAFQNARVSAMKRIRTNSPTWEEIEVEGPDTEKRETLLTLAKMTSNAYTEPTAKDWYDLGPDWNSSYPFGWEPDADGFRGHIFVSQDNSTVVISVKGTSAGWIVGGGGPTTRKDKLNDNVLFSCCCARVGPTWTTVCDCYSGGGKLCDQNCLETSLTKESLFYPIGTNLYNNVTYMYPEANIWLVGHSLGGSLASLLGVTFGVPVVTFEAPGEKLAATRLHLPSPPSTQHITHVYHTADPFPMGTCNGVTSACAIAGYAMESRCHLGKVRKYDTVTKHGWAVDIRTHGIRVIVERLLAEDWEEGREVPELTDEEDCIDCYNWEFGDYKNASFMGAGSCGGSL